MAVKMSKKMVHESGLTEVNHLIRSDQGEPIGKPCVDANGNICLLNRTFGTISMSRLMSELTQHIDKNIA